MVPEQVGIAHVGLLMGGLQSHCLQESRSGVIPEQVSVPRAELAFDDMDNLKDEALAAALKTSLRRLIELAGMMS